MYQFVVGATTPRVTRMAMTSGTNKWASRAVVILQLATWSAVGIVLLQKGVTSLQKGPEARNTTQTVSPNSVTFQANSEANDLSVVPLTEEKIRLAEELSNDFHRQPKGFKFPLDPEDEPRVLESAEPPEQSEEAQLRNLLLKKTVKKRTKFDDISKELESLQLSRNHSRNSILMNLKDEREIQRLLEKTDGAFTTSENATERIFQKSHGEVTTQAPPPPPTTKPESVWESRRRLRLSHLSGGGAAAAVAMVAVGAVMLVLGPAVIVLRALDERRQERRFLKLSGRDDLPPTYEQATLMDEAPRYSSLSLNTILGPPPPPSPTSTRAQLV